MNVKQILKGLGLISIDLAAWEMGWTLYEKRQAKNRSNYWENYYSPALVERSNQLRQTHLLRSTGVDVHIDLYPQQDLQAPIIIFNHGAAGYGRIFVELALSLYDLGYTVILSDQRGQGFSEGRRGDYAIADCVQNIVETAEWAASCFGGPLFLMGGSVGGALTYYAAVAGAPVVAITYLNLFDFGNGRDGLLISRLAPLAKSALLARLLTRGMQLLKPLGWLRIPFNWLGAFNKLMDDRDRAFQAQWHADPIPPRLVSLRALASNLNTSPAIPFEDSPIPVLVINQKHDQMVDPQATRQNYERLKAPKKYLEIPFGHWSQQPEFWQTIIEASHHWFNKHSK